MAQDIFISYSRQDKALVHPFVEQISMAVGRDCWIDLNGIESGEEFADVIIQAIDKCHVVLFMLSDNSLKSPWTKREVYYAEGEGKRIVPILVDGDNLRGWFKFHFGNVDFINIRSEEHKEKLIRNLMSWLGVNGNQDDDTTPTNSLYSATGVMGGKKVLHKNQKGFYWSSKTADMLQYDHGESASALQFDPYSSEKKSVSPINREWGRCIRAVCK